MCVPAKKKLNLQAVMYLHTPYYCYNMYAVIYGSKLKSSIFLTQQKKTIVYTSALIHLYFANICSKYLLQDKDDMNKKKEEEKS